MPLDWSPIALTFELAGIATGVLFCIAVPIAYGMSRWRGRGKAAVQTVVSLPLVLPPSVLGFYLLVAFSPANGFGRFLESALHLRLVFSFGGLVVASIFYSLPFMVNPIQSALEGLPRSLTEASLTLGKSRLATLFRVELPNAFSGLLTGVVVSFAHTVGEFGVVLMIGGSIPGKTRVASIAIYNSVESLDYRGANVYAAILLAISFSVLFAVYLANRTVPEARP